MEMWFTQEDTLQSGRRDWSDTATNQGCQLCREGLRAAHCLPVFPVRTVCRRCADKLTNYTAPQGLRAQIVQLPSPLRGAGFLGTA